MIDSRESAVMDSISPTCPGITVPGLDQNEGRAALFLPLALSHARSGDAAMLSGYMGSNASFDNASAGFSVASADQNDKDYASLLRAIKNGELKARFEE
jgi:hypothetical protein